MKLAGCLQKAIRLRLDDADTNNVLGVALAKTNEFSRAVAESETARRIEPGKSTFNDNLTCVEQRLRALP